MEAKTSVLIAIPARVLVDRVQAQIRQETGRQRVTVSEAIETAAAEYLKIKAAT